MLLLAIKASSRRRLCTPYKVHLHRLSRAKAMRMTFCSCWASKGSSGQPRQAQPVSACLLHT